MNTTIAKIKTRGHWLIKLRPENYQAKRIATLGECRSTLEQSIVRLRGWDYPHMSHQVEETFNGEDFVASFTDCEQRGWGIIEAWRFHQSGQFINTFAMIEDWESSLVNNWLQNSPILDITETIYRLTEIYEFASRLAAKGFFGQGVRIEISLNGTMNRRLVFINPRRLLFEDHKSRSENISFIETISSETLLAKSKECAVAASIHFIERFNWNNFSSNLGTEIQNQLIQQR
jgi:hypothetical protein